jgi:hypothetical protein
MSLDIYLTEIKECEVYWANITHNLGEMWNKAGIYDDLYNSKGKKGKDILNNLIIARDKMLMNPEYYKQFNAKNGWGIYDNAIKFLENLIIAIEENPESIINISK